MIQELQYAIASFMIELERMLPYIIGFWGIAKVISALTKFK